jgi:lysophospholipase L1-like esterase
MAAGVGVKLVISGPDFGASAAQLGPSGPGSGGHGHGSLPAKIAGIGQSGTSASRPPLPRPLDKVFGRSVTAIGDSVMVASTPALDHALPGIYVNAMVGRQFSAGLQVLAGLKQSGQLRQVVVFGLGTNGTVTPAEISELFAEIGQNRLLVLVNTFEARPWEHEVNAILAAAARQHRHVVLANWFATIEHHTNLLWPDGIHPQPAGGVVYARIVKAAVEQVANLPG